MSPASFNAIATARGDGLDPKLRELLEQTAASPHADVVVRSDGMLQAGPSPRSEQAEMVSAVVVGLQRLVATRAK
ncbi:hypothetical protein MA20_17470 [Bradyrhizobium japonicum]|uniref:Uncharacterized protein n=1 Tax=Bradyrhizobium japonicum TaxID=375 RepID=A0A0A3XXL5_BRAJP|nr:hypothetical protein [Bradyrhizobium japonicum]KGT79130.1 hypothetical protein MA20_17470 [Bradyrhizobium japonicum]MCS3898285.1 putative regulator of Ras-like GTPase activity (Roadblock/LC7/MglB family) [Bradyrhizobium japonicum USDA 38]MCS3941338.1 putative regulator of Ras-like GTPase activity (Roadblock/LC7/MglB family) [Bradyrhizobium japonicum]MCW2216606.1 putative regulator of Ras-like GTPase activity (Roadblock/LC7/MglB family) [Bradyrhizobium japonicum]MCW2341222.1 putative regulat